MCELKWSYIVTARDYSTKLSLLQNIFLLSNEKQSLFKKLDLESLSTLSLITKEKKQVKSHFHNEFKLESLNF